VEQSLYQICRPISPGSLFHAGGNLAILATAFSGHAKEESNYERLQRFMREFEMPYAQLALFIVKALGVPPALHPGVGSDELESRRCWPQHPDAVDRSSWHWDSRCLDYLVQVGRFRHQRTNHSHGNLP
jgi:hypothetical protein